MEEVNILAEEKPKKVTLADGKEYTFPPVDLALLASMERALGCSLSKLSEKLEAETMGTMQKMIYAMLSENHPELTLEQVGHLITMKEMNEVSGIVTSIMGA